MAAKKKTNGARKKTNGAPKKRGPKPGTGGKSPKVLDYGMIQGLARIGCTDTDIEHVLGYSSGALSHRKHVDVKLVKALELGWAEMRTSLRRAQYIKAVEEGNPTMLIWLGKQFLDQREPTYSVDVKAGVEMIDNIARTAGVEPEALRREIELIAGEAGCKLN
jgi:hypothetical protein